MEKLRCGEIIRFDLESRPASTYEDGSRVDDERDRRCWKTFQQHGGQGRMQLSLFKPVFDPANTKHSDSNLERDFARYLDEQKAT